MTAKKFRSWFLTCLFVAFYLAGCAKESPASGGVATELLSTERQTGSVGLPDPSATNIPATALVVKKTILPSETSTSPVLDDPLERKLVILASEDLAEQLDVSVNHVELVSIQGVKWPDASLGCPQPSMFYAQVTTPGYRVILRVGGDEYQYNTDMEGRMILCDISNPPIVRSTPGWRSEDGK